jgi:alkylhydroperoxidase family enzyme
LLGDKLTGEILTDWRTAPISEKLRAVLGFIVQLTDAPDRIGPHDISLLRGLGVSDRAIIDAAYICVGFNIINRIADAMDFKVPQTEVFVSGAWFMRRFGYRLMSGSFAEKNGSRVRLNQDVTLIDPYQSMMKRLQDRVFSGPGTLDVSLRQAIGAGDQIGGALGRYISKVAQRDYRGLEKCISNLRSEAYSDDQIFEITVSAALGAGVRRLRSVLNATVLCSHTMDGDQIRRARKEA